MTFKAAAHGNNFLNTGKCFFILLNQSGKIGHRRQFDYGYFLFFQYISQKIHMVGLDVTRKIVLTPDLLEYMCRLNKETGEFVKKITKFYFDFHWEWEHIIGCVINDPLAVAYFINPELCKGFDSYVQIETEGISLGQSVVDSMNFYRKASNARVLTEVDVYGFFQMFLSRILDQEPEKLDILQDLIRGDLK